MGADRSALESARIIADRIADDFAMTQTTDPRTTSIEAAVLRRLLQHLMDERPDVQNIDLMILAGFCRNCLSDWYREAAEAQGIAMSRDEAREAIYGRPFAQWKAAHQREATPEQLAAFAAARQPPNQ
jgi:hypothetical protein